MAERTLRKRAGHVKVAIVRPSIIGCCLEDLVPGWTDTLAAAGGMILALS